MGFTHVELMPVTEYPFDGSWGYQPIGLFAPTSRFGTPRRLSRLRRSRARRRSRRDRRLGAGTFSDRRARARAASTARISTSTPTRGKASIPTGTRTIYNHGRREVANFLIASALFWLRRVPHRRAARRRGRLDALPRLQPQSRASGCPTQFGGNENLEAIAFLRRIERSRVRRNSASDDDRRRVDGVADGVAAGRCRRARLRLQVEHGLDARHARVTSPTIRSTGNTTMNELTFGLLYALSENFILPLSHDEVVHGKGSLLGKMPGDRWQQLREPAHCSSRFMYAHPGKKLLFMGGRVRAGERVESRRALDWQLDSRSAVTPACGAGARPQSRSTAALPALHDLDCEAGRLRWIDYTRSTRTRVIAFARSRRERDAARASSSCNVTPGCVTTTASACRRRASTAKRSTPTRRTTAGATSATAAASQAEPIAAHGHDWSIALTLPPLATMIFEGWRRDRNGRPVDARAGAGRGARSRSARRGTAAASTSRCSRRTPRSVELCLFDARGRRETRAHRAARVHRRSLARLSARRVGPACSTATACTARTTRCTATASTTTSCCSIRTPSALPARCVGATRTSATASASRAATSRSTGATTPPAMPKCVVVDTAFTWGERPAAAHCAGTRLVIYEMHVRGFTMRHPDVPPAAARHVRRPLVAARRSSTSRSSASRRSSCCRCTPSSTTGILVEQQLRNYWGYNTLAFFAPDPRYCAGDGLDEFKTMVKRLHDAGIEVHPRRRLQPHRRGQRTRARRSRSAASTTSRTTASCRATSGTTSTSPAAATRSDSSIRACCSW